MKKIFYTLAAAIVMLLPGFAHADITTGLQLHYAFDAGCVGTAAIDSSGNGNTGTCEEFPSFVTGQIGAGAVGFNGVNQYILTPISSTTVYQSAGTVSWWSNAGGYYNDEAIDAMWGQMTSGNTTPEFTAQKFSDGNLYIGWSGCSGDTRVVVAANSTNFPHGSWEFYTFTWTNGGASTLYANGVSIGTKATTNTCSIASNFVIARQGASYTEYWNGDDDDFCIYDRALSSSDVTQLYNSAIGCAASPAYNSQFVVSLKNFVVSLGSVFLVR